MQLITVLVLTVLTCSVVTSRRIKHRGFNPFEALQALVAVGDVQDAKMDNVESDVDTFLQESLSAVEGSDKVNDESPIAVEGFGEINEEEIVTTTESSVKQAKNHDKRRHKKKSNKKRQTQGKKHHQRTTCCENGGICVLGSFCHCPKSFTGRFCEVRVRSRSCGPVLHEEVIRQACTLCRCLDGVLHCMPRMFAGCDDAEETNEDLIFFNFNKKKIDDQDNNDYNVHDMDAERISDGARDILDKLEEMQTSGSTGVTNFYFGHMSLILSFLLYKFIL